MVSVERQVGVGSPSLAGGKGFSFKLVEGQSSGLKISDDRGV